MIYLKAYTRLNLGDDLLIKEVCERYKNDKIYILADKKYKKVFKKYKNLKVMSFFNKIINKNKGKDYSKYIKIKNKILKYISKKCDTFLYIGGSIFIESSSTSLMRVKELKEEINMFKKSYIIDSNFGPYTSDEYFNYIHSQLIPSLTHITFRDLYSYNLFKDQKNVSYAPDVIFSKDKDFIVSDRKKEIGISLVHHLERKELKNNYDKYLLNISKLAINYINNGFKVRILSFCSYEKDITAIEDFIKKIPLEYREDVVVDYYSGNIDEFLKIISGLDTVIATRFHAIVLGLKYCCNVISICYSNKAINMLNDLDIKEYVDFKNIDKLNSIKMTKFNEKRIKEISKLSDNHFKNFK